MTDRPAYPWAEPGPAIAALLERARPEERARLLALRHAWFARSVPIDAAEAAAVEAMVATIWRAERLVALEAEVTARLLEGRPLGELPSLATLARLRTRLERERALAERDLRELYAMRPASRPLPSRHPARLAWLAARLAEGSIRHPAQAAVRPAAPATDRAHEPVVRQAPPEPRAALG